jgi:hypothetical protein
MPKPQYGILTADHDRWGVLYQYLACEKCRLLQGWKKPGFKKKKPAQCFFLFFFCFWIFWGFFGFFLPRREGF